MAVLRPARAMRRVERPWTRFAAKKSKSYIPTMPPLKIHQFITGNINTNFDTTLNLVSKQPAQIRDNALEASRIVATNFLEKKMPNNYFIRFLLFPHQVIREKPIAQGAGADRYSRGMKLSFGKPTTKAVQVGVGQSLITLKVNRNNLEAAKKSLKKASLKLPVTMRIVVEE
ncbi:MAG: 50S ribosomal protein L16 [Candidatus Aenigmarchaeota archaeon]|nr:50S ribosomal protein L16 [Candidatus Aenigmarchaeota archaeon]